MSITFLVPLFLGIFSGFVATLPIGPAKLLAVRKFLLLTKGNENEVSSFQLSNTILLASIVGLICAHLIFFLALQFPFLYSLWLKPHFFSLFFILILSIYLYKLKDLQFNIYDTKPLLKKEFNSEQVAFLETFLFQILNPVVLPNPVCSRLTDVFLFRYSTKFPFFAGNFLGLLVGYSTFYLCTLYLLKKLEIDAPTIYRLLKIKIHQFFGAVFVIFSFICLSRTPLPPIKPFQLKPSTTKFSYSRSWHEKIWPDSFFSYDRWKRPLRVLDIDNTKFQGSEGIKSFNKMFFSQFFFEKNKKDGKSRFYHNFPQSLSIVVHHINSLIKKEPSKSIDLNQKGIQDWIREKRNRQDRINQNIDSKIDQMEKGVFVRTLVETKFSSNDNNNNKISKSMDPRLNNHLRGTSLIFNNRSFLLLTTEFLLTKSYFSRKYPFFPIEKKNLINDYTRNKLKVLIAQNEKTISRSKEEITPAWKPSVEGSFGITMAKFLPFVPSPFQRRIEETIFDIKNVQASLDRATQLDNKKIFRSLYKPTSLWNPNLNKKELDSLKRKSNSPVFFSRLMPFFRRNEFPGTIRARRGKAVCWQFFQTRPHSPFFINRLNLLKSFFAKRKKIQGHQDLPTKYLNSSLRSFQNQNLREFLLYFQAQIRKYFTLPSLIILKNLTRQLFFQPAEWEKDWNALSTEIYVECDFYGKPVSIGVKLPSYFTPAEPTQIKIINPFELRFWTRSLSKNQVDREAEKYSFLDVLGRETKTPYGRVKKSPPFWQLLIEKTKLLLKYKVFKNLSLSTPQSSRNLISNQSEDNRLQSEIRIKRSTLDLTFLEEQAKTEKKRITNNSNQNHLSSTISRRRIPTKPTPSKDGPSFNKKQKINGQSLSILFQKQCFVLSRLIFKKHKELIFELKNIALQSKKWFVLKNRRLIKILTKLSSTISRLLFLLSYRISEFFSSFFVTSAITQTPAYSTSETFYLNPSNHLSQAYLLHSLWEDRMMNRTNITSLMKVWNQDHPIKNNIEKLLVQQGILENEKSYNLTENQWKNWLKADRGFTPTFQLWDLSSPGYWRKDVEKYWQDLPSSSLKFILNQELSFSSISLQSELSESTSLLNKFLEYPLPFLQAAQKKKKLWKFDLLYRNFTGVSHDGDVDSLWQNNFDKKADYLSKLKKKETKNDLRKELPLLQREKKHLFFDLKLQTLRERGSTEPILLKRSSLKRLKKKLKELSSSVIQKSRNTKLSSYIAIGEKDKKMIKEIVQSKTKLFSNMLENWNSKVLDDELLIYNTLSSFLRFATNKLSMFLVFQDQSKTLNPYFVLLEDIYLPTHLREIRIFDCLYFHNDWKNISNSGKFSEYLINKEKESSKEKKKSSYTNGLAECRAVIQQNSDLPPDLSPATLWPIEERQKIIRFLWPAHRLEDLSCMNRFWMGSANQSRFSLLRIHTYPNF